MATPGKAALTTAAGTLALMSLQADLQRVLAPMVQKLQDMLRVIEGMQFDSADEMRDFASLLSSLLMPLGMRIKCPTGKYEGLPARLSVASSGPSRQPRFCFLINDGKKTQAITEYANGMRVPQLTLCSQPPDRRRRSLETLGHDCFGTAKLDEESQPAVGA